jgi:hypothetical protein
MTVPEGPAVPSEPPSPHNVPYLPQPPIVASGATPGTQPESPEAPPAGLLSETLPNGANVADLIRYAIAEEQRFNRLQRLIWTVTGLGTLALGAVSVIAIIAYPHLAAGKVGLAAAAVAAGGLATRAWRWIRNWLTKRVIGKSTKLSWPGGHPPSFRLALLPGQERRRGGRATVPGPVGPPVAEPFHPSPSRPGYVGSRGAAEKVH